jgi:hypothetical protein
MKVSGENYCVRSADTACYFTAEFLAQYGASAGHYQITDSKCKNYALCGKATCPTSTSTSTSRSTSTSSKSSGNSGNNTVLLIILFGCVCPTLIALCVCYQCNCCCMKGCKARRSDGGTTIIHNHHGGHGHSDGGTTIIHNHHGGHGHSDAWPSNHL